VNYLALLGWSPRGDEEIVALATMIEQFRLEDVAHSPAFFDVKKLTHMNGDYIRALSLDEFVRRCAPWVQPWSSTWRPSDRDAPWTEGQFDEALFYKVAHLVQERVATLGEVPSMVQFFFVEDVVFDDAAFDKTVRNDPAAPELLRSAIRSYEVVEWRADLLHDATLALGESLGLPLRKSQAPIRCAVTGSSVGPPLFESLELLGRDATLKRLRDALVRAGV
jgi:glutamyl-tRNA synthetase